MNLKTDIEKLNTDKSPLIDGETVTFTYKGTARDIYLVGDYNNWELQDKMKKHPHMDLWYITKQFPENARFDYKYVVDGSWITDPLNQNITAGGAGDNSTLIMPKYKSDYEQILSKNVPRGRVIKDLKYNSISLSIEMKYHIYLPFGYEKAKVNCMLYALDGSDYLNFSNMNLVLDYMIHMGEIPNLVCVLLDPHDRTKEYTVYEPYYNYVIKELIPEVETQYTNNSGYLDRAVIGVSWGGLTSIYLAACTPGYFKRVLSQSGSFWPKDWLIFDLVSEAVTPQIKFILQTGTIQDTEEMNDAMVNILKAKSYTVDYTKYAESHSWGNWKGHISEGLRKLYQESN
ncbi:MAG TPA: alpha/beta hydrolase-fold protein [Pseudobacteroides sp.]|uniref:alpha/beta hydrolase-fold protein n=1 Tax=Pseudobacteroides sp. TaxID=1968840 RepID=UPI002F93A7D0